MAQLLAGGGAPPTIFTTHSCEVITSTWQSALGLYNLRHMFRCTVYELGSFILQSEAEHYGIDWDGPVSHEPQEQAVNVPVTESPLSETDFEELLEAIPPLEISTEYGIDIYERALDYASSKCKFNLLELHVCEVISVHYGLLNQLTADPT